MTYTWIGVALLVALADWLAVIRKYKNLEYMAHPAVMAILFIWIWQAGGLHGPMVWFALGVLFSMAGDIFLMLPREQFILGLAAFLLAHIAYLVGFNMSSPPFTLPSLIIAVGIGLVALRLYRGIKSGLAQRKLNGLTIPVAVYSLVISLMLLSAVLKLLQPEWQPWPAILVSLGALMFFLSDSFLAWNKFVTPLRNSHLIVIVLYHLGQISLVLGTGLHYLPAPI